MRRRHAESIIKWAENDTYQVWVKSSSGNQWTHTSNPMWFAGGFYKVVAPEYVDAMKAYCDGEMEFKQLMGGWEDWKSECCPAFDRCCTRYRRKSKAPVIEVTVVVNGETVSPSTLSKESWEALRS
jgi:hypothetical protein